MKTKTYSEFKGEKPFDWNEFLNKKEKSIEEILKANKLARNWVTCACGNQCSIIPRDKLGRPMDNSLSQYGTSFAYSITYRNWHSAKYILKKIEERSAFLIKEIKMV